MPDDTLKTTPLHNAHIALDARMTPFGGYTMPLRYGGTIDEHRAVREAAGLFDVSHMGEVRLGGADARAFAQHLVTNDAARLPHGKAMYAVMCHPDGTAVDDLLVYPFSDDEVLLVVNAANTAADLDHIRQVHAEGDFDCSITDETEETALLALQGPKAFDIASAVTDLPVAGLPFYHYMRPEPGAFLGCERALISHTGYTGEPGVEIYCEADRAQAVWDALMEAGEDHGLLPCGLGARDTLRLESGFCLYGHELSESITPLEAGLGWVVKLGKDHFVGKEALEAQKERGVPRKLVGVVLNERGIPRAGCDLAAPGGEPIGVVTSGTLSPMLQRGIGLGFVPNEARYTEPGVNLRVIVRGRELEAVVVKPPFHKNADAAS